MDLQGKRVLVTGASRGIGEALARAFAGAGSAVALVARSEAPLRALADELGAPSSVHPADLLDPAQVATLLQRVEHEAGPLDVVVNNAGIGAAGALWELDPDELERTVRLNLTVPLELCRQAIPSMLQRGGGHLVNVASLAAVASVAGMTHYAGSKAGLAHATAALRYELAGLPIGVTLVLVGGVPTDLLAEGEGQYEPFHLGFERLRRTQLVPDTPADKLAAAVVDGVRRGRRTVYLPRRAAPFVGLVEAPRRIVEAVLTGVPHRRS
jgi:short-subunit dehydrogenase